MIDLKNTPLGSKKRVNKQYRCGSLHIRGYGTRYTVYMDRVDPLSNPLEHLLVDAPEHLAGTTAAFIVVRRLGTTVYGMCKKEGKSTKDARHRCGSGWIRRRLCDRQPCFQDGHQLAGKEKE